MTMQNLSDRVHGPCEEEMARLRIDLASLRTLNRELADALEKCIAVFKSEELLGVFQYAAAHSYNYTGPTVDVPALVALVARAREADAARKGGKL
jgi:hypothetical protein